ncbi:MAG: fibronectin type III domain-containing protein [Treponema sp.]|jgi:hypothetical protein|nr:fibronectin type III domain-containing protein [Treponema sp.]
MKKLFAPATVCAVIALAACSVPLEGPGVKPITPAAPVLTAGSGSLTAGWNEDAMVESYNLYCSTTETPPAQPAQSDITGVSATITGLTNDTTYYVWLQAVNRLGTSSLSGMAQKKLSLEAPDNVSLTVENGTLTVNWNASDLADSYNVYCSIAETPPGQPVQSGITETSATITGLTIRTVYYVWIEAVNKGGKSPLSVPQSIKMPAWFSVGTTAEFSAALTAINTDVSDTYAITLTGNITSGGIAFTAGTAKTIILKGDDSNRIVSNTGTAALFTLGDKINLVLDANITLDGNGKAYPLVQVSTGGNLTMKTGSTVTGAKYSGVYVGGGSFTMSGGTISGNTTSSSSSSSYSSSYGGGVYVGSGSFTMSGGTISGNTASYSYSYGGGVYVGSGSFTKTGGGTIDATNSAKNGKVAYVYSGDKKRNSTAGPDVNLNSNITGSAGGWE